MDTSDSSGQEIEPGKLFVGGLSWETTKESLKEHFAAYGEVAESVIMIDPNTNRPRGFGFVQFKDPGSVELALRVKPHTLDNKTIDPKQATAKGVPQVSGDSTKSTSASHKKKVFVGGLPSNATPEDVKAAFATFGNVTEVDIKYDKTTLRMRGFGFVGFDNPDVAAIAASKRFVQVNDKKVEIKPAEPRYGAPAGVFGGGQGYSGGAMGAVNPMANYGGWGGNHRSFVNSYQGYYPNHPQQTAGQQQYTTQSSGPGYGFGASYAHNTGQSYPQYAQPPRYSYEQHYAAATQQPQQMSSYGQDSTSYSAPTANTYATAEGYHNTAGYGYNEANSYHYDQPSQVASATGYHTAATQQRGAATGGYNSFGPTR